MNHLFDFCLSEFGSLGLVDLKRRFDFALLPKGIEERAGVC